MKCYAMAAAAVLASATTACWAEPSVSVFGFVEMQVGRQTQQAPGTQMFDMGGSRIGFKGEEDLGGGLKAQFYLEHRFNPDDGSSSSATTFWKGGSWVGLSSDAWGSVKMGRWWSQAFLKSQYAADPFGMGTLGEGTYGSVGCGPAFRGGCLGAFWVNNSVSYEKSLGPVSFGVQYAPESPVAGAKKPWNVGVSYADGPLYVGAGYEASNDGSADERWSSFAANYDLGAVKLYGGYGTGRDAARVSRRNLLVGLSAPFGPGEVIASYDLQDQGGTRVEQLASLGYKYHLSKRTNVFAVLANDSKAPAGTNKTGYAVGVFHAF
jgi:predicted porin